MRVEFMQTWRHVFKLDPDKRLSDEQLERMINSGTDALLVGGSSGVTQQNISDLAYRLKHFQKVDGPPLVLEVSDVNAVAPGFDFYLIPSVLNTAEAQWISGAHRTALTRYGDWIPWDRTACEGYLILNHDCEAARMTAATAPLTLEEALACVTLATHLWNLPIIYIEYSGMFGDMEWLRQFAERTRSSRLFYGGGITRSDQARAAAEWAHTIVVGNALYTDFAEALLTVAAVCQTSPRLSVGEGMSRADFL